MKRLITLIGAAALGFAAFADAAVSPLLNKVENFEGFNVGDKITNATSYEENSTVVYPWSLATDADEESATIAGDDSNKYIALETDTRKPLCRAINNREASTAALTPADIGDGIFLDAKVKFTCAEEAAEIGEGTKLCIWAKQTEAEDAVGVEGDEGYVPAVEAATNLIVTAGGALTAFADVTKTDYELNLPANFDFSAWHRVTVRAIKNVTKLADAAVTGFVVFIDENPVAVQGSAEDYAAQIFNGFDETNLSSEGKKFFDARQLFVSLVKTGASGSTELSYMGFAGSGAADNIAICDKDGAKTICQFAIGQQTFTITIASAITDFSWQANDGVSSGTKATIEDGAITVDGSATMITFTGLTVSDSTKYSVKGATGGTLVVDLTALEAPTIELAVDTIAFIVNDKPFSSFEAAFAEALTSGKPMILNAPFTMAKGQTIGGNVEQSIVLDLNGETLTYDCTNLEEALFTVVANGTFQIIDSKGNSKLTWNKYRTLDSTPTLVSVGNGDMIMGALTGDAGATIDGVFMDNAANPEDPEFESGNGSTIIYKGFFDYNSNLYVSEDDPPVTDFFSALVVSKDSAYAANEGDTLWVVTPKAAPVGTKPFAIIIAGETETTTNYYDTLDAAIAAAGTTVGDVTLPSVVTILENVTIENKVEITKNITLDLNGKTLARDNNVATLFVIKDATLTINGATAGSTLVGRLNVGDSVYNGGVRTDHWDGALVINGGTYSVGDGQTVIHVNGDCLDAAVTINNATLTSPTDNGVQFNGKGTFAINNSTINGATAVYIKAGSLTIDKDSVINATATTWTAPVANHNGSNPTGDAIVMDSITGYQGAISLTVADGAQVMKVAEGAATIRETITDATDSTTVKIDAPTIGGIALTEAFLAKVANGSAQLPGYVAAIGTVPYQTLAAAVAAAKNDDTIKVIADCTVADAILVDKAVTLDATGKTVTCAAMYPFFVKGGDLTITDGTFTQNVVDGIILWAKDGGKITVNGGDFSAIPDGEIAYVSTADALIKIYGGKFVMADKADGSKGDVLNVAQTLGLNKTDYIQVYGGSFSKDPDEGDDALGPTFVADGYASVKQDNGLWKVGAAIIATFKVDDAIVKAETNIVAFTPVAPTNPSKEGYTFTGWTPAVDEISKSTVFVAQFKAEETKVDPEQPIPVPAEKTPEQVAEQMNTKGIANYLKVPTVVTDAAAYTAMFAAKADGNTVIIALKPTVEAKIKAELANTATSGSMLNPDATTSEVTITARPGLFYGIKAVGDVTTIGTANGQNWVQASGDTVNVVRPTVSGNAAFFQAVCSPKAPPANN